MATTKARTAGLAESDIVGFRTRLRGPLLAPADAGYDEARRVWNTMIDRHPALIARCLGVGDVINAVEFARTHGLVVSVRGGGHNIPGNAVCDGGLMIDLSHLKSIRVYPAGRTARAEPGVRPRHRRRDSLRHRHLGPHLGAGSDGWAASTD